MSESAAFQSAVERIQRGDAAGAEAILAGALQAARTNAGSKSAAYAQACYEYGSALAAFGQVNRALGPFRDACAVDLPHDRDATRSRLTYLVQFGELLEQAGELDEAERVLRESLAGRATLYGKQHAGYAFGLEPLAAVLLRRGAFDEALTVCDEAVNNFVENGHERLTTALTLRAEIVKTIDGRRPAFLEIQGPDELFEALAEAVFGRSPANAAAWSDVLRETHALLLDRFGRDHDVTLRALSHIANHEQSRGAEGDSQRRQDALRSIAGAFERRGDPEQTLMAKLALALAQSDAGDQEQSLATYSDAAARAKALGKPALRAKVLRNMGLLLAAMDRRELAEKRLRGAVKMAKEADDAREIQAARVALGIFLQHGGRLDEARGYLRRSIAVGDPAHPDALCARAHLDAIESGASCGCGDMSRSLAAVIEQMVRGELTDASLLQGLDLGLEGERVNIDVRLTREPTGEELEQLQAAVHRAEATVRERIRTGRMIPMRLNAGG